MITIIGLIFSPSVFSQKIDKSKLEQDLKTVVESKDYEKAAYYSYQLAKSSYSQKENKEALDYLDKYFDYSKKSEDELLEYLAYQLEGDIHLSMNDAGKALNSYKKSLKAANRIGRADFEIEASLATASAFMAQGRHKRAISPLEEGLSLSIVNHNIEAQERAYDLLIQSHKALGNSDKVKEYETLLSDLAPIAEEDNSGLEADVDSQATGTTRRRVRRNNGGLDKLRQVEDSLLAVRYSLEETEQSLRNMEAVSEKQLLEIDLLNKDKELADLEIKAQNARLKNAALIRNFIIVALLLTAALVVVLIRSYRKKIEANKEIDRQNKNIQSSINYAKRIQDAMLVNASVQESLIPESFILFKPRDSVSGDFYWFSEIKSWYDPDVVFAAVDCTGHGIPGAFMSLVGINALNNIVNRGEAESNQILENLDIEIRQALQQETTGNRDGMDIALCIYRKEKNILEFSGAKNPLIYIQDGELHQIKGDSRAIGGYRPTKKKPGPFKKHVVPIDQPTMIYVFSDGFQDQFGGGDNSKFMIKKFKELLLSIHHLPLAEQKRELDKTIEDWKGKEHQTDDILVMGIRLDEV
ncbi:SpoIIE family protein phosphatase [Fulvivirga ligni]|uniref:SpoIIE family protein phosphatase n=1 Tax=Fulvivirga ligni TaxID=2904246 RepID=UPI001F460EFD|nr:SpoIIE family protein phosphatase [Fulvivirga ligni]UII23398.1 SpoIIE family protein phosphatase [Fulvivirga ligni]